MPGSNLRPDAASGKQRTWHPWQRPGCERAVREELVNAIRHGGPGQVVTDVEQQMRAAEFKVLIREAQQGQLRDETWKTVERDPTLWELRWRWNHGLLVRAYFHEPVDPLDKAVVGRVHIKDVIRGDDEATKKLQNEHIDIARHRITFGTPDRWGLDESKPLVRQRDGPVVL